MNSNSCKENVYHEEDNLSNLPDDILTKILSHLERKELVRSGILSKRWKSVWLSVPTLVFVQSDFSRRGKESEDDDTKIRFTYFVIKVFEARRSPSFDESEDDDTKTRFSNFVNKMLIARKLPSLEKVSITYNVDPHLVELWVQSALERDVSNLEVNFFGFNGEQQLLELTYNLFSYNKLVVLKLSGCIAPNFLKPSSCFPSLKELELQDIYYINVDSLPNLLSNCPIVEYLTIIRDLEWSDKLETLIITSRSVKRLTVDFRIDSRYCRCDMFKVVIDAPVVEYLYIQSDYEKEYVVKNLSSLVKAEFDFLDFSAVVEILKRLPQLENLILRSTRTEYLSELDLTIGLITQLKTIHIELEQGDNIEIVRYLLMNAKVLERMAVSVVDMDESTKSGLCNVILESAADSVTWSEIVDGRKSEVIISFS